MTLVRNGLLLTIAFAVVAFGAVEVWAGSVVEMAAAVLFLVWAVCVFRDERLKITMNPLLWPLGGLFVLGVLQLTLRTTEYSYLTRVALLQLAAYAILFFLVTQAFRERRDLSRLAWF